MKFVETQVERAAAMAGGAEGNSLRGDIGVRPLAVIRGNEPWYIYQRRGRGGVAGERVDLRIQDVASAALFSAMRFMSSLQDLTNDSAPSNCKRAASASISIPASAKRASTCSASPPSFAITDLTLPLAANANSVFSGIVSMVSGAARA